MPDEMDRVQDLVLLEQEERLARLPRYQAQAEEGVTVICSGCGDEIDPRRLRAIARCKRCVQCERAAERRGL